MPGQSSESGEALASRAVFLSYAREDTAGAQRLADALRGHGIKVWFDQSELRGGDVWDQKIRRQIKECALFVPIISARTQARGEGYFRLEWKLAVERTHLMAEGVPFLAPVVVDETREDEAIVPEEFLRVQWIRLLGALPTPEFIEQAKRMLESPGQAPRSPARTRTGPMPSPPVSRVWWIGLAAVLAAGGITAFFLSSRRSPAPAALPAAPAEAVDTKSLAVLPFENMSEDKDNAFFTDGVHEDVLTNLSLIKDLHVISRTSVLQYRGTTKSIKQIGKELGVAYVLEGSVRREGNKIRVTGQLIDARTDEHVWAKSYDRDLNDIFAIQGELAQAIAGALQSVLSPETKVLLARRPTDNTEAYDDYLKAREIRYSRVLGSEDSTIPLLEAAVHLDPNFAQAWAELGSRRAFAHFGENQSDEELRLAKEAIDTAVRLAPDDPEVIEGLGDYYYYAYRDYARATEQYMRLEQLRPNDAAVFYSLGLIQRRQGRIADSVDNLRKGYKLDPTNREYGTSLAHSLEAGRHYDEARQVRRKMIEEDPKDLVVVIESAVAEFEANGATAALTDLTRRKVDPSEESLMVYVRKGVAAMTGNWAEFNRLDRQQRYFDGSDDDPRWNQDINSAETFAEEGDSATSRARAAEAMAAMKKVLASQPGNAVLWSNLALAHALLGEKAEALGAAQKSADLLPESRDAVTGTSNSLTCFVAFSWIGEKDRALAELQRLFLTPFGANVYACRNGSGPVHDDPRFKKMLADPANNAPLY
jgi:TolB-like protein/cytochrome c-type biogenesis protein CcmH/NrfG